MSNAACGLQGSDKSVLKGIAATGVDFSPYPSPISPLPPPHANSVERGRAERAKELLRTLVEAQQDHLSSSGAACFETSLNSTPRNSEPQEAHRSSHAAACWRSHAADLHPSEIESGPGRPAPPVPDSLKPSGPHCWETPVTGCSTTTGPDRWRNPGPDCLETCGPDRLKTPAPDCDEARGQGVVDLLYEDEGIIAVNKPCGLYCEDLVTIQKLLLNRRKSGIHCKDLVSHQQPSLEELCLERCLAEKGSFRNGAVDSEEHQLRFTPSHAPSEILKGETPCFPQEQTLSHTDEHGKVLGRKKEQGRNKVAATCSQFLSLVHRLDRDTSGVLLLAKTPASLTAMSKSFAGQEVKKSYVALGACLGRAPPKWTSCHVDTGHGRSRNGLLRVYATEDIGRGLPGGSKVKSMVTELKILSCVPLFKEANGKASSGHPRSGDGMSSPEAGNSFQPGVPVGHLVLLQASPQTGRTHQIRLHCQHLGIPLVGDLKYGGMCQEDLDSFGLLVGGRLLSCNHVNLPKDAHALHAESVSFLHPTTRTCIEVSCKHPQWAIAIACAT